MKSFDPTPVTQDELSRLPNREEIEKVVRAMGGAFETYTFRQLLYINEVVKAYKQVSA